MNGSSLLSCNSPSSEYKSAPQRENASIRRRSAFSAFAAKSSSLFTSSFQCASALVGLYANDSRFAIRNRLAAFVRCVLREHFQNLPCTNDANESRTSSVPRNLSILRSSIADSNNRLIRFSPSLHRCYALFARNRRRVESPRCLSQVNSTRTYKAQRGYRPIVSNLVRQMNDAAGHLEFAHSFILR